ncbi:transcriptional regulator [Planotetraspora thailandica]|uniref:Transcriptional regulator n=1 Tax=Planotetraspora thailandica TaxID=487172 RepID=A0A8J3UY02_9ACTN|nr:helix-turn-helix domain-containing protein [Planotetraspora thailandica]GII52705.1 transcriptional regulator [Planotetraspora thailandica]
MTRNVRTYDHFCLVARSLERVGDRWSLLVVRDLLTGPKRFTDLMGRLGGITPKTLSQRLHELTDVGIVAVDREPGRREVRYRLTTAGSELGPVVDALNLWGLRHAWRPPQPGEPLHVEHLLAAITQAIEHTTDDREPARWHFRFPDDDYLVECDGRQWTLTATSPRSRPDLTVTTTTDAFVQFVFSQPDRPEPKIDIDGDQPAVRRFVRLISTFTDIIEQP